MQYGQRGIFYMNELLFLCRTVTHIASLAPSFPSNPCPFQSSKHLAVEQNDTVAWPISTNMRGRGDCADPGMTTTTRSDVHVLFVTLLAVASVSCALLWWMGLLGTGKWANDEDSRVQFLSSGGAGLDRAFAEYPSGAPFAVAFYSESCMHCKQMRAPFLACSREFPSINFIAIPVNIPSNRELAVHYAIEFVPSLVYFPSSAKPDTHVHYSGDPKLKQVRAFLMQQLETSGVLQS
jgi:thiol-disulfide isomerase/thioredoxin